VRCHSHIWCANLGLCLGSISTVCCLTLQSWLARGQRTRQFPRRIAAAGSEHTCDVVANKKWQDDWSAAMPCLLDVGCFVVRFFTMDQSIWVYYCLAIEPASKSSSDDRTDGNAKMSSFGQTESAGTPGSWTRRDTLVEIMSIPHLPLHKKRLSSHLEHSMQAIKSVPYSMTG
jgi:hypothetical protein